MNSNVFRSASFILLTASTVLDGQITSSPASIEDRFDSSTLVCLSNVSSVVQINPVQDKSGTLQLADYDVSVSVLKGYKAAPDSPPSFKLRFEGRDPMAGPPVRPDRAYLFFLNQDSGGQLRLATPNGGVVQLSMPKEQVTNLDGVDGLQADIRASLSVEKEPSRTKQLLNVLSQFRTIDGNTKSQLDQLINSSTAEVQINSLLALAKSDQLSEVYLPRLLSMLSAHPEIAAIHTERFMDVIYLRSTPANLADPETLGHSSTPPALQLAAVMAIRRLHDPNSSPYLIDALSSKDQNLRYQAVMALAEIHHQYGDYAPSLDSFYKNSERAVDLWKAWAARN
jgi:hypothetical protein